MLTYKIMQAKNVTEKRGTDTFSKNSFIDSFSHPILLWEVKRQQAYEDPKYLTVFRDIG